jgi:predicted kinase
MIIEPDQFYFEDGVYTWSPERSEASWEACYRRLDELLAGGAYRKVVILVGLPGCGKSTYTAANDAAGVVVFDGLFVPPERRACVLAVAAKHRVPVEAVWIGTDLDTCLARNARRSPDRRVPEDAIRRMKETLDASPPSLAEGLAAVHRI